MAVISQKWPLTSSSHGGHFPKVAADLCETWRLFLKSGRRPTILRSSLNVAADLKTQWSSSKNQRAADLPKTNALRRRRTEDVKTGTLRGSCRPTTACSPSHPQIFPITPSPPPSPPRPSSTQSDAIEKLLSRRFHAQASTPRRMHSTEKNWPSKTIPPPQLFLLIILPSSSRDEKLPLHTLKDRGQKTFKSERPLPAASIGKEPKFYMLKLAYRFNFSIPAPYIN